MGDLFGVATWPGVRGFISCEYTCSRGVRPSIASITIPVQDPGDIAMNGDLVITDQFRELKLAGARVIDIQYLGGTTTTPQVMALHIADRRWMWEYGYISGKYNQVETENDPLAKPVGEPGEPTGPFVDGTERSATELIKLCFKAMNWDRYTIESEPKQAIPVQWDDENPASALQNLLEEIGYSLSYRPYLDDVLICPEGSGDGLPLDFPIVTSTPSFKLPDAPAKIVVAGGPTMYTDWLSLEPIGYEEDGRVRPIDDLSYKPDDGWKYVPFGPETATVKGVKKGDSESIEVSLKLAKQHVFRAYRVELRDVATNKTGQIEVGGYGKVEDRRLIRMHEKQYSPEKDKKGRYKTAKPVLIGSVYLPRLTVGNKPIDADRLGNTHALAPLPIEMSIDRERGIVTFNDYVIRRSSGESPTVEKPLLLLQTSFEILKYGTQAPERYEFEGVNNNAVEGCPNELFERQDIIKIVKTSRSWQSSSGGQTAADSYSVTETVDNEDDLKPIAEFYHQAVLNKHLSQGEAQQITYGGIWPASPGGLIQQVTWRVGGMSPCTTTASTNTEHASDIPKYWERLRIQQVNSMLTANRKIDRSGLGGR